LATELLAVGQVRVALQPMWRTGKADTAQRLGDGSPVQVRRKAVHDGLLRRPSIAAVEIGVGEQAPTDRRLARAARPDDQADLPVRALDGNIYVPLVADRVLLGHVEHAPDLLDPEARFHGRFDQKVSTRHVNPSSVKRSKTSRWCSSSSHATTISIFSAGS